MQSVQTRTDAVQFLRALEAPTVLILHGELVGEVAEQILESLDLSPNMVNHTHVIIGAVLHDIGKIKHVRELHEPGHAHEVSGHEMLLLYQFPHLIADMCVTHAQWRNAGSFEALIVALADRLWKGKRDTELEDSVIQRVADLRHKDFWSVYTTLELCFDRIAENAAERLARTLHGE